MQLIRRVYRSLTEDRIWWWLLLIGNVIGFVVGAIWYWPQLMQTPWYEWILVPSSPGSMLLFALLLVPMLRGKYPAWFAAIAYLSVMKYGLWSTIVLPFHAVQVGYWEAQDIYIPVSHLFMMAFEGFIYGLRYPVGRNAAVFALAAMLFKDFCDYVWLMTHPFLVEGQFTIAAWTALVLTLVIGAWLLVYNWDKPPATI